MKIRWSDGERAISAFAAGASLVVAVTCSGRAELGRSVDSVPPAPTMSPAASNVPSPASASPAPPEKRTALASPPSSGPAASAPPIAPRLFAALADLEQKRSPRHVRILWLGDSHTAADFMTHAVREGLKRFKTGGPGHLLLGMKPYRHGMVKSELIGGFRVEPNSPALSQRQGDGIFGLAGVRTVPETWEARLLLTPHPRAVPGRARWELIYRLPPGASFRFKLGNGAPVEVSAKTQGKPAKGGPLPRIVREAAAGDALEITAGYASPQLFGAILEGTEPGLVIDTLGINGARASTPLAWEDATFVAEVAARDPEMFVLAYGTNEAFDVRSAERHAEPLRRLVERMRRGAPRADCLVLGPPDAADAGGGSLPRIGEVDAVQQRTARELGCGFFSLRDVMGGDGSFARWAKEKPPLASPDRVHLTPAGYAKLGEALARALLDAYSAKAR